MIWESIPLGAEERFTWGTGSRAVEGLVVRGWSRKCVVTFHGAVDRSKRAIPVFDKVAKATADHTVVCLADATLNHSNDLGLGWYLGGSRHNPDLSIVEILESLLMSPAFDAILLAGGSGGGYAALRFAPRYRELKVLALNPTTNPAKYFPKHVRRFQDAALNGEDITTLEGIDLRDVWTADSVNVGAVLQESSDLFRLRNDFLPFFEHILAHRDSHLVPVVHPWTGRGHVRPPGEVVDRWINALLYAESTDLGEFPKELTYADHQSLIDQRVKREMADLVVTSEGVTNE